MRWLPFAVSVEWTPRDEGSAVVWAANKSEALENFLKGDVVPGPVATASGRVRILCHLRTPTRPQRYRPTDSGDQVGARSSWHQIHTIPRQDAKFAELRVLAD